MSTSIDYDPDATAFTRRMAAGHLIRTGHNLTGYYEPTADDGIVQLVRTCCGDNQPTKGENQP